MNKQDEQNLIERSGLNEEKAYIDIEAVQEILNPLVQAMKKSAFVDDYDATDEEALGIVLAKYFEWNGKKILEASAYALEDSNYHTECHIVADLSEMSPSEIKDKYLSLDKLA